MPSHRAPTRGTDDGLRLEPFRGWSFDRRRVDVDDVVCPPYDVVEPDEDERLRERSAYNVVRLVRPKGQPIAPGAPQRSRYEQAADLLSSWQRDGLLVRAGARSLYVYEQRSGTKARRGVIGALEVRDPADLVVVPHEDVFAVAVADRFALMTATDAQLEPILLTTDGLDSLEPWLTRISATRPDVTARPDDGTEHRLWRVEDPAQIVVVQDALRGSTALIADGHHRYATYQRLQAERRAAGLGAGPWDHGLALLVGSAPDALSLGAIHRTVRGAVLPAPNRAREGGLQPISVTELLDVDAADADALLAMLTVPARSAQPSAPAPTAGIASMLATDGTRVVRIDCRPVGDEPLARLPAAVMAERVLPQLFGRLDRDRVVDYHHVAADAISGATTTAGVALLLPAPSLQEVRALAEAGVRMPRKSTSFGPKPRSGLVLRGLDD